MELRPSDSVQETVRLLVGPLPPDAVPSGVRCWLDRPEDHPGLGLQEVRWLRERLAADGAAEPLSELLRGGRMELPAPVTIERNPELEVRCSGGHVQLRSMSYLAVSFGLRFQLSHLLSIFDFF